MDRGRGIRRALAPAGLAPNALEARWAVLVAAGLYLVGAALCATAVLLPDVGSPAGVAAVGVVAVSTALLLVGAARRGAGLRAAFVADLWGITLIAVLCASGGGASSPFALIYMFATLHAAGFQPRRRVLIVCGAALVAFLLPLAYEDSVPSTFVAVACVGIVSATLANAAVYFALNWIREQRRRARILTNASALLDRSLDPAATLRAVAALPVPALVPACVIDVFDEGGGPASTIAAAADPALVATVEQAGAGAIAAVRRHDPLERLLADALVQAKRTDAPAGNGAGNGSGRGSGNGGGTGRGRGAGAAREPTVSNAHRYFPTMQAAGYVAAASYPMVARGRTHGVISYWRRADERPYDLGLLSVLEDLSGRAAVAYDNARLYAERAQVARTLRRSLMPAALPEIPGLELASYFRPMGAGSEVGGDFYDVIGDRYGCWLMVGDVCGKGAEAAALTAFVRHTAAAYAREVSRPGLVFSRVNRAMLEHDFDGCFATAILARVSFRGAHVELTVATAGHPAALVARADGDVLELGGSGTLLGVFPDTEIEEVSTIMLPGDALALYTDGLTEAHAPRQMVSVAQMIASLQHTPRQSPQDAIDALLDLIEPGKGITDDIAILAAQVDRRARAVAGN